MNSEKANAKYNTTGDKKRQKKLLRKDMVMVYLRRKKISAGAYNKLKPKKYGPFKILKKITDNTYVVNFPSDMMMSKTFNVTEQLNLDYNSRRGSFKKEGTDVGDQDRKQ